MKLIRKRKRVLKTAALVCKGWREFTLPYLYAVITVDVWRQRKSFLDFFDFLRRSTTIPAHIKELHLSGPPSKEGVCDFEMNTFVAILPTLTALHTLSIKHIALRVNHYLARVHATHNRLPFVLRKLTISYCGTAEPTGYLDTFSAFLSCFRADILEVEEFFIVSSSFNSGGREEIAVWSPERCIFARDLVIGQETFLSRRQTALDIYGFLTRLIRPGAIRAISMTFSCYSPPTIPQLHDFLRSAPAQNIVSIDFHLVWDDSRYPRAERESTPLLRHVHPVIHSNRDIS